MELRVVNSNKTQYKQNSPLKDDLKSIYTTTKVREKTRKGIENKNEGIKEKGKEKNKGDELKGEK